MDLAFLTIDNHMVGVYKGQIWLNLVKSSRGILEFENGQNFAKFAFLTKLDPHNFIAILPIIILNVFSERE